VKAGEFDFKSIERLFISGTNESTEEEDETDDGTLRCSRARSSLGLVFIGVSRLDEESTTKSSSSRVVIGGPEDLRETITQLLDPLQTIRSSVKSSNE
jgi:hypothetical protein